MSKKSENSQPQRAPKPVSKKVAAYHRADGKRIAAFRRKPKTTQLNSITGKPRRWLFGNNGAGNARVNDLFEMAEVEAAMGYRGLRAWSPALLKEMFKRLSRMCRILKEHCKDLPSLTEAEIRYCKLEDIDPADYLTAKR